MGVIPHHSHRELSYFWNPLQELNLPCQEKYILDSFKNKKQIYNSSSTEASHHICFSYLFVQKRRPSYIVVFYVILTTNIRLWVAFNVNHILLLSIRVIVCLSLSCGRLLCLQSIYISVMGCKCISSPWVTIIYI